jgi:hypothetical protein
VFDRGFEGSRLKNDLNLTERVEYSYMIELINI